MKHDKRSFLLLLLMFERVFNRFVHGSVVEKKSRKKSDEEEEEEESEKGSVFILFYFLR